MFDFLFSMKLDNLQVEFTVKAYDVQKNIIIGKPLRLRGSDDIMRFIKCYVNKEWLYVVTKTNDREKLPLVSTIELENIKFVVQK